MQINKSGKLYLIERHEIETDKQLIERSWFIVNGLHLENNNTKSSEEIKEVEKYSRLSFNTNVLQCKYSDHIEKKIKDIEDKIFV